MMKQLRKSPFTAKVAKERKEKISNWQLANGNQPNPFTARSQRKKNFSLRHALGGMLEV
jgi:hypothetical protein